VDQNAHRSEPAPVLERERGVQTATVRGHFPCGRHGCANLVEQLACVVEPNLQRRPRGGRQRLPTRPWLIVKAALCRWHWSHDHPPGRLRAGTGAAPSPGGTRHPVLCFYAAPWPSCARCPFAESFCRFIRCRGAGPAPASAKAAPPSSPSGPASLLAAWPAPPGTYQSTPWPRRAGRQPGV
jgi:hypothetical protein